MVFVVFLFGDYKAQRLFLYGYFHGECGGEYSSVYSACCNADKGIYYYTTYENRQITAVDLHRANLDGTQLIFYPLVCKQNIAVIN